MNRNLIFSSNSREKLTKYAAVPLRLIVGYGFVEHGMAKWAKGPDAFGAILQAAHVPAPYVMAWLTIITEFFGGLAILFGAFVALVSLPNILLRGGYCDRPSTVWIQFHQADEDRRWTRAVRPPWIRVRPALYRLYRGACAVWPEPVVGRCLPFAPGRHRFALRSFCR